MPAARISCQTPRHRPQSKPCAGRRVICTLVHALRAAVVLLSSAMPIARLFVPLFSLSLRGSPRRSRYARAPYVPPFPSRARRHIHADRGKESAPRTRLSARSGKLPYRSVCYVWLPCTAVKVSVLVSVSMCMPTHVSNASESPLSVVSADVQVTCA